MARNILNNGTVANDGTGDSLRDAIDKINFNFTEIYNKLGGRATGDFLAPEVSLDSTGTVYNDPANSNQSFLRTASLTASRTILLPDESGTLLTTSANQAITNPVLFGTILDSNQNELITFISADTAVNNVEVQSSNTGNNVVITTTGDDADVSLDLTTKGDGLVELDAGLVYKTVILTGATDPVDLTKGLNIYNRATAVAATMADGTVTGQKIKLVNIGAGTVTVTPTNLVNGTTVQIPQNGYAEAIWVGSSWLVSYDGSSALTIS